MCEQIERVFDASSTLEWSRIDGDAQLFGELAPVEGLGQASDLHCSLQEPTIQVVLDHAIAEVVECSLREGWSRLAEPAQDHLPAKVDDRELHDLGIGC